MADENGDADVRDAHGDAPQASSWAVFLSYNNADVEAVGRIARRLRDSGHDPWFDRWTLTAGERWQPQLESGLLGSSSVAVMVGPSDLGGWEREEVDVALSQAVARPGFRVIPVLLPGIADPFDPNTLPPFLATRTWVDFRRGIDDTRALQDLVNAIRGVPFGADAPVARDDGTPPYRGLAAFTEADAGLFFGREREVQRLLEKLKSSRFVGVLGPSGSGKSSLVRAGLVPALHEAARGRDAQCRVLTLRPGATPLTALAAQLAKLSPAEAMGATLDRVADDARTLHLTVELALADRPATDRVVVVVDQLEELFTLCHDAASRSQLLALLVIAASTAGGRTLVIVTLRDDFYGHCAAYAEFAQLLGAQQQLVPPMNADDLRQAIEQPARRVGLQLEEGLADTILADVAAEPGALPLLEHALLELWTRRRGSMLTLEGYRDAGGVDGALAQRAEAVYRAMTDPEQATARRVLLRLTQPGEGTEDTRRRAPRAELRSARHAGRLDAVLARLVDARLLTAGRDETGTETVDVSHEALIRGWPRLRGWIDADRAGLITSRRLTDAAREWQSLRREPGALYRGARLAAALEWGKEHADDLNPLEHEFLAASELAEHDELRASRRRTRRLRLLLGGVAALAAVVTVVAIWALDQRAAAQRRTAEATALALATTSRSLSSTQPHVALALAFEAHRVSDRREVRDAVQAAGDVLLEPPGLTAVLHGDVESDGRAPSVGSVRFSSDGRFLASASDDGGVQLWDVRTHDAVGGPFDTDAEYPQITWGRGDRVLAITKYGGAPRFVDAHSGRELADPFVPKIGSVDELQFSADGRTLATFGGRNVVRTWDNDTHRRRKAFAVAPAQAETSVSFSPDLHLAAVVRESFELGDELRLWDVGAGRALGKPLTTKVQEGIDVHGFDRGGRLLATTWRDDRVQLWDTRSGRRLGKPLVGPSGTVQSVAFSPDGRTLATTADRSNGIWLWDVRTHRRLAVIRGHTAPLTSVAFSPDGRVLASASDDGTVRLWDMRHPKYRHLGFVLRNRPGFAEIFAASGDGRIGATAHPDGTVEVEDRQRGTRLGRWPTGHGGPVNEVALDRRGSTLATASDDKTVRLWDVRTHRRLGTLADDADAVLSVAFSPDGRTLATGGYDATARIWDVGTRRLLGRLRGHTDSVLDVAFSPDAKTLATAGFDETARLWSLRTRRQVGKPLIGHTDAVAHVVFSPDGRFVATSSEDLTVRRWSVASQRQLGPALDGGQGDPYFPESIEIGFSRGRVQVDYDGNTVDRRATSFLPPHYLKWRGKADLRKRVCALVGGLSRGEWRAHAAAIPYRDGCA
jgi:WD40 repeat protein/energy-coupling factor transporter ATP-binding protein EcfA2